MTGGAHFQWTIERYVQRIQEEMKSRCYRGSDALRNAALEILEGERNGRIYQKPNRKKATYQASAAGEPPARRSGTFRKAWKTNSRATRHAFISRIVNRVRVENGHALGNYLEHGTQRMAARPHQERIRQRALPEIQRIYQEPYLK